MGFIVLQEFSRGTGYTRIFMFSKYILKGADFLGYIFTVLITTPDLFSGRQGYPFRVTLLNISEYLLNHYY